LNVHCHACIGVTSLGEDLRKLNFGQHVVCGTPGRVFGMCNNTTVVIKKMYIDINALCTHNIKTIVLDEADEMLNKEFKNQIYDVYCFLPPATQV